MKTKMKMKLGPADRQYLRNGRKTTRQKAIYSSACRLTGQFV